MADKKNPKRSGLGYFYKVFLGEFFYNGEINKDTSNDRIKITLFKI
jgi:hypothetical protein